MPRLNLNPSPLLGAALALGLAGAAAPALSQTVVDGLTVTGHWRVGDNVRELSQAVPYDDLDLNTVAGREILRQRVRATADDLCDRLGESSVSGDALVKSCRQDAMDSARHAVKVAIETHRIPVYAYLPPDEPYVAPAGPTASVASGYGADVSATVPAPAPTYSTTTVTNGSVPDTPENRARYGEPMSNGGRLTSPAGN